MFIGREKEILLLDRIYSSPGFEFLVMYGRRRVGKTYLLANFLNTHSGVYFMAKEKDQAGNIQGLWKALGTHYEYAPEFSSPKTLGQILDYIDAHSKSDPLFLVIDEYQWFADDLSTLNATIQEYVDRWRAANNRIHLVLCGSVISMMRDIAENKQSPLYGRQTAKMELLPFSYREVGEFFPTLDSKGKLEAYMITGGVGYYLSFYSPSDTPASYIKRNLVSPLGPLRDEMRTLIREEVRKGGPYLRLMQLIAEGKTSFGELLPEFENKSALLSSYLETLREKLNLVEKCEPALGGKGKAHYRVSDLFSRLYFSLIYPNIDDPSYYIDEDVFERRYLTQERLNTFFGSAFEVVCQQYMNLCSVYDCLPAVFPIFRNHWDNEKDGDHEFDLASLSKNGHLALGECKWRNKELTAEKYFEMKEYAESHFPRATLDAYFFSREGFSSRLKQLDGEQENIHLFSLDDLFEKLN